MNAIAIGVFVGFAVWYVAAYFLGATNGLSYFASVGGFLFSLITELVKYRNSKVRRSSPAVARLHEFDKPINREGNLGEFKRYIEGNVGRIHIISGESGCGKTTMIEQFCETANNDAPDCAEHVIGRYYNMPDFGRMRSCRWVFFDQFEQALRSDISASIVEGVEALGEETNVIISIRKERLGDLCSVLSADYAPPFFLKNTAEESLEIGRCFSDVAEESPGFALDDERLESLAGDFANNRLTYIQLRLLLTAAEAQGNLGLLSADVKTGKRGDRLDYDVAIKAFLVDSLAEMEHWRVAECILFLLSLDDATGVSYGLVDFQNAALCSRADAEEVTAILERAGWIRAINRGKTNGNSRAIKYEMSHDYLRRSFHDVFIEEMNLEVKKNIEFYHARHSCRANEVQRSYSQEVNKAFLRFFGSRKSQLEPKSKAVVLANVLLAVLLTVVAVVNLTILLDGSRQGNMQSVELALVQVTLLASVYYVYNYFVRFLCILGGKGIAALLAGLYLCCACLLCESFWGVWLGVEVIVVGAVLGFIRSPVQTFDEGYFKHRAKVNIATGALIAILGCFLFPQVQGDIVPMLTLFALYGLFIGFCIMAHINEDCLMAHVGKVLYVADK